jgi:hypothetical protein
MKELNLETLVWTRGPRGDQPQPGEPGAADLGHVNLDALITLFDGPQQREAQRLAEEARLG